MLVILMHKETPWLPETDVSADHGDCNERCMSKNCFKWSEGG